VSNSEERDRQRQPPYADPSLIIDTRLREVERQQAEEKRQQQEYNRKQLRFNGLLVLFTALLVVTSIMSNVLMLRYVNLTKESADAATSAANTSREALEQAKLDSATQGVRNREAMRETSRQSKAALDASIEGMRTDQRAWVGIKGMRILKLETGQPIAAEVIFTNQESNKNRERPK